MTCFDDDEGFPLYPRTIYFGTKPLEIRFQSKAGIQTYFCHNNETLHLTQESFDEGTYTAGAFLGRLCATYCAPHRRGGGDVCPAFVASASVGKESHELAAVEMFEKPLWEACGGVRHLLEEFELTPEEKFLFLAYPDDKYTDEREWRDTLIEGWNRYWGHVACRGLMSRRRKFERMVWSTLRFPALVPQVWLNWLYSPDHDRAGCRPASRGKAERA
jgi:hypothetical protein